MRSPLHDVDRRGENHAVADSNSAVSGDLAPRHDALVSDAMDRVLAAERAAQDAIAECERDYGQALESARQQGRAILERAEARIVALHARAAQALTRRAAEAAEQRRVSGTLTVEQLSDPARRAAALVRLAARLTSTAPEPGPDAE